MASQSDYFAEFFPPEYESCLPDSAFDSICLECGRVVLAEDRETSGCEFCGGECEGRAA